MEMTPSRSSSIHSPLQLRAEAELERRRRGLGTSVSPFERYRYDVPRYLRDTFGWEPWAGDTEHPGQMEIVAAYTESLRLQHEQPEALVDNCLRVESGHTVGKTKLAAGLVNHFFDCFTPAIVYTFAPTWEQIHDLLWKEIKADRRGKGLPGRILDLELHVSDLHFAKGRATDNAGGKGTERAQGQHGKYLLFVLDEAEGVADFVYDAVESMTSGGISIVLMLANPRTRTSRFHKQKAVSRTRTFHISCLWHPNVVSGREVVPGAVRRAWVEQMIAKHCTVVTEHNADAHTFEVPWRPDMIYRPDPECLFRMLGIAPGNIADNTFVPVGRYEVAKARAPHGRDRTIARLGVDAARYGKDYGTLYAAHAGRLWRAAQFWHQETGDYYRTIRQLAERLAAAGVRSLHIRVDGGGGFGSGVIDRLNEDADLAARFDEFRVLEVHFNGTPYDGTAYADVATEMYAHTAEALQVLALDDPPDALEADLCERTYRWVKVGGVDVKRLTPKEEYKRTEGRSPDDGDGAALAAAPDYVFGGGVSAPAAGGSRRTNERQGR